MDKTLYISVKEALTYSHLQVSGKDGEAGPTRSFWDMEYFTRYTHCNTTTNTTIRHCTTINYCSVNE